MSTKSFFSTIVAAASLLIDVQLVKQRFGGVDAKIDQEDPTEVCAAVRTNGF